MRLLLLSGSLRAGSTTGAALRTVEDLAGSDVDTSYYSGLSTLPHFNPDDDHDPLPAKVVELRREIQDADALLICTPEYAGDMPGSFKNLLDWTVGGIETESKPVGWINVSTAPMAAAGTHRALRTVLTYTGCEIVEEACVHLPVPRNAVENGTVIDPVLRAGIAAVPRTLNAHLARRPPPRGAVGALTAQAGRHPRLPGRIKRRTTPQCGANRRRMRRRRW